MNNSTWIDRRVVEATTLITATIGYEEVAGQVNVGTPPVLGVWQWCLPTGVIVTCKNTLPQDLAFREALRAMLPKVKASREAHLQAVASAIRKLGIKANEVVAVD